MGISAGHKKWLSSRFGEAVCFDEPLRGHTSFRIGGPADALVRPMDKQSLIDLIGWCAAQDVPYFILGKGTNLLVRDKGYRGIVISLQKCLNHISGDAAGENPVRVTAMAGAGLPRLCRYAVRKGMHGLNFATGIPGSVGGAVMMNAGTADGCMADVIDRIEVLFSSGKTEELNRDQLLFSYRKLSIRHPSGPAGAGQPVILEAGFLLRKGDPEKLAEDARTRLQRRKAVQPVSACSPGCLFRNPASGGSAGRLIDEAGLKGTRVGDAEVSKRHANYIINRGNATAADVIRLMNDIQEAIYQKFNVALEPEVVILGE